MYAIETGFTSRRPACIGLMPNTAAASPISGRAAGRMLGRFRLCHAKSNIAITRAQMTALPRVTPMMTGKRPLSDVDEPTAEEATEDAATKTGVPTLNVVITALGRIPDASAAEFTNDVRNGGAVPFPAVEFQSVVSRDCSADEMIGWSTSVDTLHARTCKVTTVSVGACELTPCRARRLCTEETLGHDPDCALTGISDVTSSMLVAFTVVAEILLIETLDRGTPR